MQKLKRFMGTGHESLVTEAKRNLAGNVLLELSRGTDGEEIRKQFESIIEGGRVRITRESKAVAEVRMDDQETMKEEILGAPKDALGEKGKVQVLWTRDYGNELWIALLEGSRELIWRLVE